MLGKNGIYRLYSVFGEDHEKMDQRLVGVFAIIDGKIVIMESHSGHLMDELFPNGASVDNKMLRRMASLEHSAHWRLVNLEDIEAGHHLDLIDEKP